MNPNLKSFLYSLLALAFFYYLISPDFNEENNGILSDPDSISVVTNKIEEAFGLEFTEPDQISMAYKLSLWLGTPYEYASCTKAGTDCSGFVYSFYKQNYKKQLNRSSKDIIYNVNKIATEEAQLGDIVFFARDPDKIFHVGIYIGERKFIHASTKRGVIVSSLDDYFYKKHFFAIGRLKK